jgi:two-component system cell cycle sensor histidine kinase/response regulator CckA
VVAGARLGYGTMSKPTKTEAEDAEELKALRARADELERACAEHERVEAGLRESEQRYRLMVDSASDCIYWRVPDGKTIYISPTCVALSGYSPEEFRASPKLLDEIVHPDDRQRWEQHKHETFADGSHRALEFRIINKEGQTRWVSHVCGPVYDEAGEYLGVRGSNRDITDRKRSDEVLRESVSLLHAIVSAAKEAMIAIGEEGLVAIFNPAAEKMFGRTREEMIGKPLDSLMPEEYRQRHHDYVKSYFVTGQPHGAVGRLLELPGLRSDGTVFPMEISLSAGKYGNRQLIVAVARDISQRKRVEQEQRGLLERTGRQQAAIVKLATHDAVASGDFPAAARLVTEVAADALNVERVGVWLLSEDRKQLRCADLFVRSAGAHSDDTVLETSDYPRYFEALSAGRAIDASDARTDPRTSEYTEEYLDPLGITSMLDAPIRLSGEVIGIVCHEHVGALREWQADEIAFAGEVADQVAQAMMNSERRKAGEALRQSEERFQQVADNAQEWIWEVDADGMYTYASPMVKQILGYEPDEVVGKKRFYDLFHPDDREQLRNATIKAFARKRSFREFVNRNVTKTGEIVWLLTSGVPVLDEDGNLRGYRGADTDITERKRAEEEKLRLETQVRHAQKLESLGVLAGGIAHDFNNLLVGVLGYAGLAEMELPPDSPARESIKKIEKAARRAADLTRQLLAYSGRGRFVVEPTDLTAVVEEMAHLLEASTSKKARLRYDFEPKLPPIEADATQIHQVVMNLITNASDAIGEKSGVITVTTGVRKVDRACLAESYLGEGLPTGSYVYVEVADNGCGMDEQTQAKVFDPFFTTKFTGRGLGLAAVLGIVRGHRGAIRIRSIPGQGTTVTVLFPSCEQALPSSGRRRKRSKSRRGAGVVLVVDDEETVRAVAKTALEKSGFTVLTAASGPEALRVCRERSAEIVAVLLDMTMPHLGGEEVFNEMRRIRPDLRVILTSGYDEQEATRRFVGKGLAGFIQKPYLPAALVEKVQEVLAK